MTEEAKEDTNPDNDYIDTVFVKQINGLDNESLRNVFTSVLEKYKTEYNYDDMEKFSQEVVNLFDCEINTEHFLRQIKYIINKGIYGRINKKYKNDLLVLGFEVDKIEIISEVCKKYFEINLEKNEKDMNAKIWNLKDFDMMTEMPVHYSKYMLQEGDEGNNDIKKQQLIMNLRLSKENGGPNNTEDKREIILVDKNKMIGLFQQFEKLQEQLDKLG